MYPYHSWSASLLNHQLIGKQRWSKWNHSFTSRWIRGSLLSSNLSSKERPFSVNSNIRPWSSSKPWKKQSPVLLSWPTHSQPLQFPEIHPVLLEAKSSSLWKPLQVRAHPASTSSHPATHQVPYHGHILFQFFRCSWPRRIPFYLGKAQSNLFEFTWLWQAL